MAFFVLFIGAILIVAAVRNSQGDLFTAIKTDAPDFAIWAAAIVALGVIGFVPGLKPISRGLLALVILVLILRNYQNIIAGFNNAWQGAQKQSTETAPSNSTTSGGSVGGLTPWDNLQLPAPAQ